MYSFLDKVFGTKAWSVFLVFLRVTTVAIFAYILFKGLDLDVPNIPILEQSIRAVIYHVPLWIGMNVLFMAAFVMSIAYLIKPKWELDHAIKECVNVGIVFGLLGFLTGMQWASTTWGSFLPPDIKVKASAITMLIYLAYVVLRSSFSEFNQRAKISAVYNIFSFVAMLYLIWVLPRQAESLHPGNGGNPLFSSNDMDGTIRPIFRSALIGYSLLACWIANVRYRISKLDHQMKEQLFSK
jgi:heme exporter protein C